jgi:NADH-quinone oxidoreductase subunit N
MIDNQTALSLIPELILLVMVVGAFIRDSKILSVIGSVGMVAAACALVQWQGLPWATDVIQGSMDSLSATLRWLAFAIGLLLMLMAARPAARSQAGELLGLVVLIVAGLMFVCGTDELVLMFLGLELISVPTYALLFIGRKDRNSGEAAVKYFFLSILSSALFVLGLSLLYGATGATRYGQLTEVLAGQSSASRMVLLSVCLIFAGLGFKIAAVPFHFYAPDVYMATTNLNAGLLAVVPKVAGIAVLIRFAFVFAGVCPDFVWQLALIMSMLTMTIGKFCALWQTHVRRLLAYSSIAHSGYLLIGVVVAIASINAGQPVFDGMAATLLYLAMYAFASLGTFAVLSELSSDDQEMDTLEQLSGVGAKRPWLAGALAIFLFSLAGIPPLAGFWGKFTLIGGALSVARAEEIAPYNSWFFALVVVALLNAAVGAVYYLRVIGTVYFGDRTGRQVESRVGGSASLAAMVCAVVLIGLGILPSSFVGHFQRVGESLSPGIIDVQPAVPSVAVRPQVSLVRPAVGE